MCSLYKLRRFTISLLFLMSTAAVNHPQFVSGLHDVLVLFLITRYGIRCNVVLPGFVQTSMLNTIPPKLIKKVHFNLDSAIIFRTLFEVHFVGMLIENMCRPGI